MQRLISAAILLSVWVLALAPAGLGQGGPQGPLPFDPHTVITVQGMVVDAPVIHEKGIPEMIHLTLKTDQGSFTVILGPNWFMARQGWRLAALDRLEVTGSRIQLDGKPALVAQEVKKGDKLMKFRDQRGTPLWGGPRGQSP